MTQRTGAAPRAGRMIAWTAVAALACWGVTLAMVRAVAQDAAPPAPPATVEDPDSNEEAPVGPPRAPAPVEDLPEYRDSADNNISLPVDI